MTILPFPLTRFWRQLRRCQQGAQLHGTQAMALSITTFQAALRARGCLAALGSRRWGSTRLQKASSKLRLG